jgi:hypothetical protein
MTLPLKTLTCNDIKEMLVSIAEEISIRAMNSLDRITDQQQSLIKSRKMLYKSEFEKRTSQLLEERKRSHKVECIFDDPNNQSFYFIDHQMKNYRLNYADYYINIVEPPYSNRDHSLYRIYAQIKEALLSPLEQSEPLIRYVNLNAIKVKSEKKENGMLQTRILFRFTK